MNKEEALQLWNLRKNKIEKGGANATLIYAPPTLAGEREALKAKDFDLAMYEWTLRFSDLIRHDDVTSERIILHTVNSLPEVPKSIYYVPTVQVELPRSGGKASSTTHQCLYWKGDPQYSVDEEFVLRIWDQIRGSMESIFGSKRKIYKRKVTDFGTIQIQV